MPLPLADRNRLAEDIAAEMFRYRWRDATFARELHEADDRTQTDFRGMAWRALQLCEERMAVPEPPPVPEEADEPELRLEDYLVEPNPEIDEDIPF